MASKVFEIAFKLGAELQNSFRNAFSDAENKMSGLANAADKLGSVGKTLSMSVTAPIVGLGAAALKIGTDFDAQMSKVAAVSGATGKDFDALRAKAQELGATTKFTASQVAEGQEYLALAGYDTNQVLAASEGLLNLAAAANMELGTAADITTDVMSAFGMAAEQSGHAADVFAYAQANANTNVEQMGEAMKYAAPLANQMGWTIEQTGAAMMKLADNGLKGSIAGQAFASSVGRLAKPTKAMQNTMDELGISFFDANENMKSLPDVIAELEKGTDGLSMKQKSAAITTLFGAEAYKHWAILLESGSDTLADYTTQLENSDGTAQRMADTMNDNFAGSLLMLRSALEGVAIQLSDLVKDDLRAFADYLTKLTGKFGALDESTKKTVLIVAGIAAAIGPVLVGLSILITAFINVKAAISGVIGAVKALSIVKAIGASVMRTYRAAMLAIQLAGGGLKGTLIVLSSAFKTLTASLLTNPIFWVAAAVIGLGIAFYTAYKHSETFRNAVNGAFASIRDFVKNAVNYVTVNAPAVWNGLVTSAKELPSRIQSAISGSSIGKAISNIFANNDGIISGLTDSIKVGFSSLPGILSMAAPMLTTLGLSFLGVTGPVGIVIGAVVSLVGFLYRLSKTNDNVADRIGAAWNTVKTAFEPVIQILSEGFSEFATKVGPELTKTFEVIAESIGGLAPSFVELGGTLAELSVLISTALGGLGITLASTVVPIINTVIPAVLQLVGTVIPLILAVVQTVFPVVLSIIQSVLPIVIGLLLVVAQTIVQITSIILPILLQVVQMVFPIVLQIVQTIIPVVIMVLQTLVTILNTVLIPAINGILAVVQFVFPYIQMVIQNALTIVNGIIQAAMALLQGDWDGAWNAIKATAETIMTNIISFFSGINLFEVGKAIINGLIDGIASMGGAVVSAISGMIPEPIRGAASKIMGAFGGKKGGNPIPEFAVGGIVDSATLAWVGEGGDTESIIPWNNSQRSKELWMQTGHALGMLNESGAVENMQQQIALKTQQSNNAAPITPAQIATSNNTNNNNSPSIVLQYSPQYNVQNPQDLAQVQKHAETDKIDLEARIAELMRNERRTSFGD